MTIKVSYGSKGDGYEEMCTSYIYITGVPKDIRSDKLLRFFKPLRTFWISHPDKDMLWTHSLTDEQQKIVDFIEAHGYELDTWQRAAGAGAYFCEQATVITRGDRILIIIRDGYDV